VQNRWIPRRATNDPRKIEDIHKDFVEEKQKLALLSRLPPPTPSQDAKASPGVGRGGRGKPDAVDELRLSAALSKPIDPNKMKISKPVDVDNIQLGPPGGRMGQSKWSGGSTGGSSTQSSSKEDHNGLSTPGRLV
jgi:hypothetical protein